MGNTLVKPWAQGRREGVCLGGGGAKCLATAARGQKFCASPEKVAQRGGGGGGEKGGLRHIFFPTSKNFQHKFS